jgi:NAD(P)-dependent dehydrogenase (short-subunit alcohol dehydrogenase family)
MAETLVMIGVRKLGRTIALHFAERGWQVVCAARTRADVQAVAAAVDQAGGTGIPVVCDLGDRASLAALLEASPTVNLCVAAQTAGGRFGERPLLDIEDEELERGYAAYVRGSWNLLKVMGPRLLAQGHGTFLQIGTSSGVRTKEGFAALGTVQHALRALVQVAAKEWREKGVHVAYLPIDGGIAPSPPVSGSWAEQNPTRVVPPEHIAQACEYLHRQTPAAFTHELVLRPSGTTWTAPT